MTFSLLPFFRLALVAALFLSVSAGAAAQSTTLKPEPQEVFEAVDQMPEYPGGVQAMMQYLGANIRYKKDRPAGLVVVSFVVNKDKNISEIKILKSLHPELDSECIRVVQEMSGQWTPGVQKGKQVAVRYTLPVRFEQPAPAPQPIPQEDLPYTYVEHMPQHTAGEKPFLLHIANTISAPKSLQGMSAFTFVVNRDGTIEDIEVIRSVAPKVEKQIVAILEESSGQWLPGKQNGKLVRVRNVFAVSYPLQSANQPLINVKPAKDK